MNDTTFITDTGASRHMVYSNKYLTDMVSHIASVTAADNDLLECREKVAYRDYFKNSLGQQIPVYLTYELHAPGLNINLFSITKRIDKPRIELKGMQQNLSILVNGVRIDFEKQLTYGTGKLYASDITPTSNKVETEYTIGEEAEFVIINFYKFHSMMGHPHNSVLKQTARANNVQLTGVQHRPRTIALRLISG
jgi:hypothetical protein